MSLYSIISGLNKVGGSSPAPTTPLIIMTGESNTGGRALNSSATSGELLPTSAVKILNNTTLLFEDLDIGTNNLLGHAGLGSPYSTTEHSWELQLANRVTGGAFSVSQIHLLKAGQGGTKIADWDVGATTYLGTDCWQIFQDRYNAAIAIDPTFKPYIFYQQGINDGIAGTNTATWKTKTSAHFAKIRTFLGADTPIFFAKLMTAYSTFNTAIDEVVAATDLCWSIQGDDASLLPDGNHFDYAGQKLLANRLIDKLLEHYSI